MCVFINDPYRYENNDRDLWLKLLNDADNENLYLFGILYYLRSVGAKLVPNKNYGYIIQPIIDRNSIKGWENKQQYDEEAKNLVPYKDVLIRLLKAL